MTANGGDENLNFGGMKFALGATKFSAEGLNPRKLDEGPHSRGMVDVGRGGEEGAGLVEGCGDLGCYRATTGREHRWLQMDLPHQERRTRSDAFRPKDA